jgi:hypothetical protein
MVGQSEKCELLLKELKTKYINTPPTPLDRGEVTSLCPLYQEGIKGCVWIIKGFYTAKTQFAA